MEHKFCHKGPQRDYNIDLSDIRPPFDGLIETFHVMSHHLSKDADIVHCENFESVVVNCILGLNLTGCHMKTLGVLENKVFQIDKMARMEIHLGLMEHRIFVNVYLATPSPNWVLKTHYHTNASRS